MKNSFLSCYLLVLTIVLLGALPARAQSGTGQMVFADSNGLYIELPEGGEPTQIPNSRTGDSVPSFNSDATKVIFQSSQRNTGTNGQPEIYMMGIDGEGLVRLTQNTSIDGHAVLSPDDSLVVFHSTREGTRFIYTMPANGTGTTATKLTDFDSRDPVISPDGLQVAFTGTKDGATNIWVINIDGTNLLQLTTDGGREPEYSRDGGRIVYTNDVDDHSHIFVMNADGTDQNQVTFEDADDRSATFSPDGNRMAFISDREGNEIRLFVMNVDGSDAFSLTEDSNPNDPYWGADSGGALPTPTPKPGNAVRSFFDAVGTFDRLEVGDDPASQKVPLGFTINYFGKFYDSVYVNQNGSVTFNNGIASFQGDSSISEISQPIIAPFYANHDTTTGDSSRGVYFGQVILNGRPAFEIKWYKTGYSVSHSDKANLLQLILISRGDCDPGAFDMEFNYNKITWETGDESGGVRGFGGHPAEAGFSNGFTDGTTLFPNSATRGKFLDSNQDTGLIYRHLNSPVPGRYIYYARNNGVVSADTAGPTVDFSRPMGNSYVKDLSIPISGAAQDCLTGMRRVELTIQRKSDNFFWSGVAWKAESRTFITTLNPASGTWLQQFGLPQFENVAEGDYMLHVTAFDKALTEDKLGNRSVNSITVHVDRTAPTVKITSPANNGYIGAFRLISAEGTDAGSGIGLIECAIQRNSDDFWWNGTAWVEQAQDEEVEPRLAMRNSNGVWQADSNLPPQSEVSPGGYKIKAVAFDKTGNSAETTVAVQIDNLAPTNIQITNPVNGKGINSFVIIEGIAQDNAGGSGISGVSVLIYRKIDANFWTGSKWVATTSSLPAVVTPTATGVKWSLTAGMPAGSNLAEGAYRVAAVAFDGALNSRNVYVDFRVDVNQPQISISDPVAASTVSGLETVVGAATDNFTGSGIDATGVKVSLRRRSDNTWWNTTTQKWVAARTTPNVGGGTNLPTTYNATTGKWVLAVGVAPSKGNLLNGAYTVVGAVFDRAGNSSSTTVEVNVKQTLTATTTTNIINEKDVVKAATITVTRNTPTNTALALTLKSDSTRLRVPATATIAAGQSSATINVVAVQNTVIESSGIAHVEIAAAGHAPATLTYTVLDDDAFLTLTVSATKIAENQAAATATVQRSAPFTQSLVILIANTQPKRLSVPPSVTLPAGAVSTTFKVAAINNAVVDGGIDGTVTVSGTGYKPAAVTVHVADDERSTLTVTASPTNFSESGAEQASIGRVTRKGSTAKALVVSLTSSDPTRVKVPASVIIPINAVSIDFRIEAVNDEEVQAVRTKQVTLTATGAEFDTGTLVTSVTDDDVNTLNLTLSRPSIAETAGPGASVATVTRNTPVTAALTVTIGNTNPSKIKVATATANTVVIPAGAKSAEFKLDAIDNELVDGTQVATIAVRATGFVAADEALTILDGDARAITVTITPTTVAENTTTAMAAKVTRNITGTELQNPAHVILTCSNTRRLSVPTSVDFPAGAASVNITVKPVNNDVVDGNATVTVTGSLANYQPKPAIVTVQEDDTPLLTLTLSKTTFAENAGSTAAKGTLTRNAKLTTSLIVTLSSDNTGKATVPANVTFAANATKVEFNIAAVNNSTADGSKPVVIAAVATGFSKVSQTVNVTDDDGLATSTPTVPTATNSNVRISGGAARSAGSFLQLVFSAPLDPDSAVTVDNYAVLVNGRAVTVEGAFYSAYNNSVTLVLPAGSLPIGAQATVSWNGLLDAHGAAVGGQGGPFIAK